MSSRAVNVLVYQVRHAVGDRDANDPVFSLPRLLSSMERAYFMLESELENTPTLSTSFISVVADDYDYSVGSDFEGFTSFRRTSDGQGLVRESPARWHELRQGNTVQKGPPIVIAFEEAASGALTALLWPTPNATDTIEAFREASPSTFSTLGIVASADLSAVSISMGQYGIEALVHLTCWQLTHALDNASLARLGIGSPDGFKAAYRSMLDKENTRILQLRRASQIWKRGIR